MKTIFSLAILALVFNLGHTYSKYGRSCNDIGCLSSETCVMAETPCSFYTREDECGQYPTCKKTSSSGSAPSCTNYVCPPTKICHLDGNTPKCVDDTGSSNSKPYNHAPPSAPAHPGIYPQIPPHGQTTTRPPVYRQGGYPSNGGGYQGGSIGSGYPGQPQGQPAGAYPSGGSNYPGYPGGHYPSNGNGYPAQGGYPSAGGYPQSGGGYPANNYPYGSNQGGGSPYGTTNNNRYGTKSGSEGGLVDKITDTLKSIGLFCCINIYYVARMHGL